MSLVCSTFVVIATFRYIDRSDCVGRSAVTDNRRAGHLHRCLQVHCKCYTSQWPTNHLAN